MKRILILAAILAAIAVAAFWVFGGRKAPPKPGDILWKVHVGYEKRCPAVSGGLVYFLKWDPLIVLQGQGLWPKHDRVIAVEARTGRQEWSITADRRVFCGPVAGGDTVVFADRSAVHAVSKTTGAEKWRHPIQPFSQGVVYLLGVFGKTVYFGCLDGLHALAGETGNERWVFAEGPMPDSQVVVASGVVLFADGEGTVYALDEATGAEKRRFSSQKLDYNVSSAAGPDYLAVGDKDSLFAYDSTTAKELWRAGGDKQIQTRPASLLLSAADGAVYFSDNHVDLRAVDARTGRSIWTTAVPGGFNWRPAIYAGTVYVFTNNNVLLALDAKTGRETWRTALPDQALSDLAAGEGIVAVNLNDGYLYAVMGSPPSP